MNPGSQETCKACHKEPISYACVPCGHATLCKKCAMKQVSPLYCAGAGADALFMSSSQGSQPTCTTSETTSYVFLIRSPAEAHPSTTLHTFAAAAASGQATGGKCKVCGNMFGQLKRLD
jgi:hypothetical protein